MPRRTGRPLACLLLIFLFVYLCPLRTFHGPCGGRVGRDLGEALSPAAAWPGPLGHRGVAGPRAGLCLRTPTPLGLRAPLPGPWSPAAHRPPPGLGLPPRLPVSRQLFTLRGRTGSSAPPAERALPAPRAGPGQPGGPPGKLQGVRLGKGARAHPGGPGTPGLGVCSVLWASEGGGVEGS